MTRDRCSRPAFDRSIGIRYQAPVSCLRTVSVSGLDSEAVGGNTLIRLRANQRTSARALLVIGLAATSALPAGTSNFRHRSRRDALSQLDVESRYGRPFPDAPGGRSRSGAQGPARDPMQRLGIDADDVSMKLSVRAAGTATFPDELDAGFLQKERAVNRLQTRRRSGRARPAPRVAGPSTARRTRVGPPPPPRPRPPTTSRWV
jgi:hypothetical protein